MLIECYEWNKGLLLGTNQVHRWQNLLQGRCGKANFGWVLRDSHGAFIVATVFLGGVAEGARMAEALRVREVLSWLKEVGAREVDVEMNAHEVFHALRGEAGKSYFDLIIDDIKVIILQLLLTICNFFLLSDQRTRLPI
nr:uncharacterized protein LOC109157746 [Ipomoea trifida]